MKKHFFYMLLFISSSCFAQSDFDYSQRMFNESIYNPAATGNSFTTSVFLHARKQWVGLDGAPNSQAFSADTYIEHMKSAIGLSVLADQIGFTKNLNVRFAYAYYVPIAGKAALSFGLSAAIVNRNVKASSASVEAINDPELLLANANEYTPDFDFGIELTGPLKIGATVRHLLPSNNSKSFPALSRNFWTYASFRFNASQGISVEPTASVMHRDKVTRTEVGTLLYFGKTSSVNNYNDKFWFGGMYRLNSQFALLAGAYILPRIRLGYSFDYGTGDLQTLSKQGTHELFLSWQFNRIFHQEVICPAYKHLRKKRY